MPFFKFILVAVSILIANCFMDLKSAYGNEETSNKPNNVGRKAASKYFASKNNDSTPSLSNEKDVGVKDFDERANDKNRYETRRLLSLHYAQFLSSKSYKWGGDEPLEKTGRQSFGLTYKMGEWIDTMDLNLRIDYQQYEIGEDRPAKLSFLSVVTFPDVAAHFPIYFGGGVGPGIFIASQVKDESPISLDYQLFLGARMVNLIGRSGIFIEYGVKDHLLILTDGQFIGQYLAMGMVFSI